MANYSNTPTPELRELLKKLDAKGRQLQIAFAEHYGGPDSDYYKDRLNSVLKEQRSVQLELKGRTT